MDSEKFVFYRKKLGLTQKELAQLLLTSVKAIIATNRGGAIFPKTLSARSIF